MHVFGLILLLSEVGIIIVYAFQCMHATVTRIGE